MGIRFHVHATDHLERHGLWVLSGRLIEGEIRAGSRLIAETSTGPLCVTVRSVAFVDPPPEDPQRFTLTIERPDFPIELLRGTELTGNTKASN